MESLTHVHPIVPLLLWVPLNSFALYIAFTKFGLRVEQLFYIIPAALIFWTFVEYTLHRYLFHFPAKNAFTKRLVFLFHGLHHDDPDDPTRLVMPPFPALLIGGSLYLLFGIFLPHGILEAFFAFFMTGYLIYDYIHYATHHFPMKSKVGKYLRKYHLTHHFKDYGAKYGVSSPLWDYIFRTVEEKGEKPRELHA